MITHADGRAIRLGSVAVDTTGGGPIRGLPFTEEILRPGCG
jgi:hypothetical protein